MLQTSEVYKKLLASDSSIKVHRYLIDGVEYTRGIQGCRRTRSLFAQSTHSFGGCYSASLELGFVPQKGHTIKRNAEVQVFTKLVSFDGTEESEEIPQGTFYIAKRSVRSSWTTLTCYDAMMKLSKIYAPQEGDIGTWPRKMSVVVKEIFDRIGIELDPRTTINDYDVEYPNTLTEREILGYIAAAHGANWVITQENRAHMVPYGFSQGFTDLGTRVESFTPALPLEPVSRVVMYYDEGSEDAHVAGDSDDCIITGMCPWVVQEMCDTIYNAVKGVVYNPYSASSALVDPAAELGDTVAYEGSTYLLASQETEFTGMMPSELEAPCEQTTENEFEYMSPGELRAYRERKRVDTTIERNTDSILLAVRSVEDDLNESVGNLQEQIDSSEGRITELEKFAELSVTKEEVSIIVGSVIQNGVDQVTTKTGFTFNDEGMTISKSGTQMTTQVTENGLYVRRRDTDMLVANANGVEATDLKAKNYLIIADRARFEAYGQDRVGCFWVGGNS